MKKNNEIIIRGAKEHNLKDVNITIPKEKFVVFTGLSGSGKSSLAFDTIYAEGQRRYVESLSSYARMFLGQMDKPDVEFIEGLSPAISIDQKTTSRNPRSTVGTVTEIYDYLRLLYARVGVPHCPQCHKEIKQQSIDEMVDRILSLDEGTKFQILAPVVRGKKGEHTKIFENAKKSGFVRARVDGEVVDLYEEIKLEKTKKHSIEIVVDRLVIKENLEQRLTDSLETALDLGEGLVYVDVIGKETLTFSKNFACPDCGISIEELSPRMFSFNSPFGACPHCSGIGNLMEIDPDMVIPDKSVSFVEGAIVTMGFNIKDPKTIAYQQFGAMSKMFGFDLKKPVSEIPEDAYKQILYGTREPIEFTFKGRKFFTPFEGIIPCMERRYKESLSPAMKAEYEEFMGTQPCPVCHGDRLKKESLAVTVGDKNLAEITNLSVKKCKEFFESLTLSEKDTIIAKQILKEINARLEFLINVGLEYLTLSRSAGTLSGGEAQRIRLATQIGSGLTGVLYILDEPSIGLHQRDNNKLLSALKNLRDLGNTLIVVEHDEDTMFAADHIVDIGPGAGVHGGEIVAQGTVADIIKNKNSITGQYLSGDKRIPIPQKRRKGNGHKLKIFGASQNNLKGIDVEFPLGKMIAVTGVSGSGKSSLVNEILYKTLANQLNRAKRKGGTFKKIEGLEHLDKVINIDQSPIGRTPRSNPATYTGVFTDIREVFARTNEAKMRGYGPGRFSFNISGGRCEACQGDGILKIEMHFLSDVYVPCEVCKGKRYNRETLEVKYKGKSISDVLEMTVEEGLEFFKNIPKIERKLRTLYEVGLGYIKIGQPSTTLSGGEAQRVKLATELSKRGTGKTMYILDEPTTGLHTADVHHLVEVLNTLCDNGNTVVVIEHNLDVIKTADHIIDLGPEGGDNGGTVIATGTPEKVSQNDKSHTGRFLKKYFQ